MSQLSAINRMAVVLRATEAYLDWAKTCPDTILDMTLDELNAESTVYLLPETDDDPMEQVSRHFESMFVEELFAWCQDDAYWPKDLSLKTFRLFFDVQIASMVFDLGKDALIKEGGDE